MQQSANLDDAKEEVPTTPTAAPNAPPPPPSNASAESPKLEKKKSILTRSSLSESGKLRKSFDDLEDEEGEGEGDGFWCCKGKDQILGLKVYIPSAVCVLNIKYHTILKM